MAVAPVMPIGAVQSGMVSQPSVLANPPAQAAGGTGFADLLAHGLNAVDTKVAKADELMKAYALGEAVPVHQVTIALEEARIAVELAVQVRERMTETYRSFMNMQL